VGVATALSQTTTANMGTVGDTSLPQTPPSSKQACVNNFYASPLGKTTAFLSPLSLIPGWGPHPLESGLEYVWLVPKAATVQAGKAAAGASIISLSGESPIASGVDWLAGKVATAAETVFQEAALPVTALATAVDLAGHDACDPSIPIPAPGPF